MYPLASRGSNTFTRLDGGFGVQGATWTLNSLWEHYMIYNETERVITVNRVD